MVRSIVLISLLFVVTTFAGICDGEADWLSSDPWTSYTVGDLRVNADSLWECTNVGFSYYEPSGPNGHYGWANLGSCVSALDTTVTIDTAVTDITDTTVVIDTIVAPHTDTTVNTDSTIIRMQDSVVTTDSLENGISFNTIIDTIWSQHDTVNKPTDVATLPFVVQDSLDTTFAHLIGVVLKTKADSTLSASATYPTKFDTVVVITDSTITTDTTVRSIATWEIDPAFSDTLIIGTVLDTTLPPVVDTAVVIGAPDTLFYAPTVTTTETTYADSTDTATQTIDSVVQGNLDTIVTTIDYAIRLHYSILQTDTFWDAVLYDTQYDTTPLPSDTLTGDTTLDTLVYVPTITTVDSTYHLIDSVTVSFLDSVIAPQTDTIVNRTDSVITYDTTVNQTDTFWDAVLHATLLDTVLPPQIDTVVTVIPVDTLVYVPVIVVNKDTVVTVNTTYPQKIDSVVQPNFDTIVTKQDLEVVRTDSIVKVDTLWDGSWHATIYDTLSIIGDTTVLSITIDTLVYTRANNPPVISPIPDTTIYTNANFNYQVIVTDPDPVETFTYALQGGPAGMLITIDGQIMWLADTNATPGLYFARVTVTDSYNASDVEDFYVTLEVDPGTPVIPHATTKDPVKLYPNPVRSGDHEVVIGLPLDDTYRVRVFDALGTKVLDKEGSCSEKEIRWTPDSRLSGRGYLVVLETETVSGRQAVRRSMLGVQR